MSLYPNRAITLVFSLRIGRKADILEDNKGGCHIMKRQMAVFLKDSEYGARFVRYLRQLPKFAYEVVYFSEKEACEQFLQKQGVELFIFSGEEELEPYLMDQLTRVIYLSDQESPESIQRINPFQSMEQICLKIWPDSAQFEESIVPKQNPDIQMSVITILNLEAIPEKVAGTSIFLEAFKEQKNAILVDFSQFTFPLQQESKEMESNTSYGLSDVLYYLSSDEVDLGFLEQFIIKNKGLARIQPVNHCLDVLELTRKQMNQFLELINLSGYQTVIAILSVITDASITLLERSKSILYMQRENEGSGLLERVKNQLSDLLSEEDLLKFQVLSVKGEREVTTQLRKSIANILGNSL